VFLVLGKTLRRTHIVFAETHMSGDPAAEELTVLSIFHTHVCYLNKQKITLFQENLCEHPAEWFLGITNVFQ
jgi:hypothetical protein